MSTVYSPAGRAPEEPAPAAQPAAEGAADAPPTQRRPLVQRVPTPLFVFGYGALLIALVVGAAMLASYAADADTRASESTSATTSTAPTDEKRFPLNPAPADPDAVRSSIRDYLVADVETGATFNGTMAKGTITPSALQAPDEFSGHVSRLLEQNCLNDLALTTPDNVRVNFLGFCFSTVPPETIATALSKAEDLSADSVSLINYNSPDGIELSMTWLAVGSTDKLDDLMDTLWKMDLPAGVHRLLFKGYSPDTVKILEHVEGQEPTMRHNETGDAYKEKWDIAH